MLAYNARVGPPCSHTSPGASAMKLAGSSARRRGASPKASTGACLAWSVIWKVPQCIKTVAWRNRSESLTGRTAVEEFLPRKWQQRLDYRMIKEVWAFETARIAVWFAHKSRNADGAWFPSYGNKTWEFDAHGPMRRRVASINDVATTEADRLFLWPLGRRPDDHPGRTDLGL